MSLRDHAKGQWPMIVSRLLGEQYANPRKHHPCPGSGGGKDCFRLSDKNGAGNFFCKCSQGEKDGFDLLMCARGWTFAEAASEVEGIIGKADDDGAESKPPEETRAERLRHEVIREIPGSQYLKSRGLEIAPGLRWHKSLTYYDSDGKALGDYPAMLAPVVKGGRFLTYHATYLQGGEKAPLDPARKILPSRQPTTGASCPLYPIHGDHLGVAEGVETAIASKLLHSVPTWACLNTSLMASFEVPEGVRYLTIFADHDSNWAGHAAAYQLAHRAAKKGIEVEVRMPDQVGDDWNDVLLSARHAAA